METQEKRLWTLVVILIVGWILSVILIYFTLGVKKVEAAEPDRAYWEPRIILSLGEGTLRSDIIRVGYDDKAEPFGFGLGLAGLVPIGERSSFVISGQYLWSKTNWKGGFEKENLRRFRISAGVRFYIGEE